MEMPEVVGGKAHVEATRQMAIGRLGDAGIGNQDINSTVERSSERAFRDRLRPAFAFQMVESPRPFFIMGLSIRRSVYVLKIVVL